MMHNKCIESKDIIVPLKGKGGEFGGVNNVSKGSEGLMQWMQVQRNEGIHLSFIK